MNTAQRPPQSRYDRLLDVYLPAIHRAARSVQSEYQPQTALEDLLMAGFQGFKEAFSQLPSVETPDMESLFSRRI